MDFSLDICGSGCWEDRLPKPQMETWMENGDMNGTFLELWSGISTRVCNKEWWQGVRILVQVLSLRRQINLGFIWTTVSVLVICSLCIMYFHSRQKTVSWPINEPRAVLACAHSLPRLHTLSFHDFFVSDKVLFMCTFWVPFCVIRESVARRSKPETCAQTGLRPLRKKLQFHRQHSS